jgi:hypothetical protein
LSQFQNPVGFSTGSGVSQALNPYNKDVRLEKHPKSKETVPKTEVLEQPQ